jgi:hypothetical protein
VADQALVSAVKNIVVILKSGKGDDAHIAYGALFASPEFATYAPADQRQALKLMVHAKGIPTFPSAAIVDAHKRAIGPLRALVAEHGEAGDYELLGLCQVRAGDSDSARISFQKGLDLERARDPQSPLCGTLMKHVASV